MRPPVLALMLCVFCVGTAEIAIIGILPEVAADLRSSIPGTGMLVTGYAVGVAILGPLVTLATAHAGVRPLLCGLMVVFVVGNVAASLAPGYDALLAARVLTAASHGTFVALAGLVAARISAPGRQATAIAQVSLGFNLANVLGAPLGTVIGQAWGWRTTFAAIAVASVASLALVLVLLPADDRAEGRRASVRAESRVLRRPVVLVSILVTVLGQGAVFTFSTYVTPVLRDVSGFPGRLVGLLLVAFGVGAVAGNTLGGRLADRLPNHAVPLTLAALIGGLLLFWAVAVSRPLAVVALVLLGAVSFAIIPALQSRVLALAAAAPVLSLSVNVSAFNLGNGFGGWFGGELIDRDLGLRALLPAAAVVAALALVIAVVSHRAPAPSGVDGDALPADRAVRG